MILPLEFVLVYLGLGPLVLIGVFLWRRDMWSMTKGVVSNLRYVHPYLGFNLLRWGATACIVVVMWLIWILVLALAVRRQILGRANVPEGEEKPSVALKKRKPKAGEIITKEQVQQLESQIAISGAGAVRGKLKETLRKKAYVFIREKKKQGQKEVTVGEALFNIDNSPEFLAVCERIGYPRADMVEMCIKLGAVEKK